MKKFLSIMIIIAMMITALPLNAAAEDQKSDDDDIILFGSYPQSEVKNTASLGDIGNITQVSALMIIHQKNGNRM